MSRTLRTAPALALLLLLALLGAAAPASAEYVRDVAAEDVADTIDCPAGSTLDRSIVVLDSAYVGLPGPAVGGIAYATTPARPRRPSRSSRRPGPRWPPTSPSSARSV